MKKRYLSILISGLLMVTMFNGCSTSGGSSSSEKVNIEFFHYKPEAKSTFDKLVAKFEKENPNIKITVSSPPEAESILRTRVSKQDIPDVVGIGAATTYADLTKAGVFQDLTGSSELKNIQTAYVKMANSVAKTDKVYGIPYATNADAVIYNKALFKQLGLTVPTTWDEFMALNKKIKEAGKTPFYFGLKDSWTTLPPFNALAANTTTNTLFSDLAIGKTTFKQSYKEASDKYLQLLTYGQDDIMGKDYNNANVAFAKGESVMYLQGIWALPEIKKANPDIDLGVFPYPVTNDPSKNNVVSGVDLLLSIGKKSKHPAEAKKFVDFLLKDENAKQYISEQKCFSAINGVVQDDPVLDGLKDSIGKGMVVDFPDHQIPPALTIDKRLQTLASSKDVSTFLSDLDNQYASTQSRK